jgi:hypothetical protein
VKLADITDMEEGSGQTLVAEWTGKGCVGVDEAGVAGFVFGSQLETLTSKANRYLYSVVLDFRERGTISLSKRQG